MGDPSHTAREAARIAGTTARTPYDCHRSALVGAWGRVSGGRRYAARELERLHGLPSDRELGIRLEEIAARRDDPDADPRFHAHHDAFAPGIAAGVRDAIVANIGA